jgi:hypothetical protein
VNDIDDTISTVPPTDGNAGTAIADPTLTCGATTTVLIALLTYPFVPSNTASIVKVPSFGQIGKYSVSVTAE